MSSDSDSERLIAQVLGDGGASRPGMAVVRRAEQLQQWNLSDTNREPGVLKNENDRKVKFPDGCVFLAACASGDTQEVEALLADGANIDTTNVDGLTALHQAVIDENGEMVEFLLNSGANIDAQDNEGWTALHAAVSCGFYDIAKSLIDNGANLAVINSDGELPIDIADSDDLIDLLNQEITKQGIDLDIERHREEHTMLEDAMHWLQTRMFRDRSHPRTGATALHVAGAKGYIKVMNILLQAGADVNAMDNDGWTPLHAAAHWGERQAVEILVEHMAAMDRKNLCGQTPLDVAEPDMIPFLEELKKRQAELIREKPIIESLIQTNMPLPYRRKNSVTRMSTSSKHKDVTKVDRYKEGVLLRSTSSSDNDSDMEERRTDENDNLQEVPERLAPERPLSSSSGGGVLLRNIDNLQQQPQPSVNDAVFHSEKSRKPPAAAMGLGPHAKARKTDEDPRSPSSQNMKRALFDPSGLVARDELQQNQENLDIDDVAPPSSAPPIRGILPIPSSISASTVIGPTSSPVVATVDRTSAPAALNVPELPASSATQPPQLIPLPKTLPTPPELPSGGTTAVVVTTNKDGSVKRPSPPNELRIAAKDANSISHSHQPSPTSPPPFNAGALRISNEFPLTDHRNSPQTPSSAKALPTWRLTGRLAAPKNEAGQGVNSSTTEPSLQIGSPVASYPGRPSSQILSPLASAPSAPPTTSTFPSSTSVPANPLATPSGSAGSVQTPTNVISMKVTSTGAPGGSTVIGPDGVRWRVPVGGSAPSTPASEPTVINRRVSFVPPRRDEESESERKLHARRQRESRRSTQGVTADQLKSAEQLYQQKQKPTIVDGGANTTAGDNKKNDSQLQRGVIGVPTTSGIGGGTSAPYAPTATVAAVISVASSAGPTATTTTGVLSTAPRGAKVPSASAYGRHVASKAYPSSQVVHATGGSAPAFADARSATTAALNSPYGMATRTVTDTVATTAASTSTAVGGVLLRTAPAPHMSTSTGIPMHTNSSISASMSIPHHTTTTPTTTATVVPASRASDSNAASLGEEKSVASSSDRTNAAQRRRSRQERRPTGPVGGLQSSASLLEDAGGDGDSENKAVKDTNHDKMQNGLPAPSPEKIDKDNKSLSGYRTRYTGYPPLLGSHGSSQASSTGSLISANSANTTASVSGDKDVDFKKLYEEEKAKNDRLATRLKELEIVAERLKSQKPSSEPQVNGALIKSSLGDKERRLMEKKISDLEEQTKQLEILRSDNQRLKEENGALIRVISKLSK